MVRQCLFNVPAQPFAGEQWLNETVIKNSTSGFETEKKEDVKVATLLEIKYTSFATENMLSSSVRKRVKWEVGSSAQDHSHIDTCITLLCFSEWKGGAVATEGAMATIHYVHFIISPCLYTMGIKICDIRTWKDTHRHQHTHSACYLQAFSSSRIGDCVRFHLKTH